MKQSYESLESFYAKQGHFDRFKRELCARLLLFMGRNDQDGISAEFLQDLRLTFTLTARSQLSNF